MIVVGEGEGVRVKVKVREGAGGVGVDNGVSETGVTALAVTVTLTLTLTTNPYIVRVRWRVAPTTATHARRQLRLRDGVIRRAARGHARVPIRRRFDFHQGTLTLNLKP